MRTITCESANNGGDKDPGIIDDWIADADHPDADADHRFRVLYSSACAAHLACNLGIGIMPIQAQFQVFNLSTELSDYHKCCTNLKTPDDDDCFYYFQK